VRRTYLHDTQTHARTCTRIVSPIEENGSGGKYEGNGRVVRKAISENNRSADGSDRAQQNKQKTAKTKKKSG